MADRLASACALGEVRLAPQASAAVRVPASTANLGPGFDSVGMALGVWDEARASVTASGLEIVVSGHGVGEVPRNESHLVVRAMHAAWSGLGIEQPSGLRLEYAGGIPHSRGMGSSASAIVGGVALAVAMTGADLDDADVLAYINDVASGLEGHPDNASASVYGQVTVSWGLDNSGCSWRTAVLCPHPSIEPMVVVPDTRLSTSTARAALPTDVPLVTAVRNSGRTALLAHALVSAPELLMDATVDFLHQEARRPAYPASMALVDALREAGVPAVISGAGPTVLAFANSETRQRVRTVARDGEVLSPGIPKHGVHAVSR